jgi:hypothetical protein
VWLGKSSRVRVDGPVMAALDPLHAHAKPAQLDSIILEHALAVARGKPRRVLRVLDSLGCDVLVVKPRGFRSDVKPRSRLIQTLPPI